MEYTPAAGTWLGPAPWDRVTHDWLTLMPRGIHSSSRYVARPRPLGQGDPRLAHLNASWNTLQQQVRWGICLLILHELFYITQDDVISIFDS